MSRRRLIIIAAVVGVLLGTLLLYIFVIRPAAQRVPEVTPPVNGGPTGLPTANEAINQPAVNEVPVVNALPEIGQAPETQTLKEEYGLDTVAGGDLTYTEEVSPQPIAAPTLAGNGRDVLYQNPNDGRFYRQDLAGNISRLSDAQFFSVDQVTWSPDGNKAVLEFPDDAKVLYNFTTNTKLDLPSYWQDFNFSPSSDQFAFKSVPGDRENRWLATASADGSTVTPIEPLGDNAKYVQVAWAPDRQRVALFQQGVDGDHVEIFFIGANGENFKSATVPGLDVKGKWTADGEKLLFSSHSFSRGLVPELYLVDAKGDDTGSNRIELGLKTWADRCAIAPDNKYAYCGVPENLPQGAAVIPEYQKNTNDQIYRIDLQRGVATLAARTATLFGAASYTVSNPFISRDGKFFYFQNADTGALHAIQINE